ncbi:MAG TPA: RidA family protein [Pyrinomonadaceae bacterium]|nr:RidA family protein [Pyrinomonadaceae bacterium]
MRREPVKTSNAPAALGPYSQAIKVGEFVYTSGQVAIDPASGEFIGGGIAEQTERVLKNVAAVLEAAGSSLDQVVKTLVFLSDMDDFAAMNEVYARFFTGAPPARSTVQAARLPKDARIEIEAVALITK